MTIRPGSTVMVRLKEYGIMVERPAMVCFKVWDDPGAIWRVNVQTGNPERPVLPRDVGESTDSDREGWFLDAQS